MSEPKKDHAYRFSVIPGGAVTDRRLEPRDLQVLALIGRHTRNGGWVFRSQVKMARELSCGRASIQRSLDRLIDAGWMERRLRGRDGTPPDGSKQPFAAYFYRPVFDNVVPEECFSTFEDDEPEADAECAVDPPPAERCPPVGTPAQPDGHPGAQPCVGTKEGSLVESGGGGGDARARPLVSAQAFQVAEQVAAIAGLPDPKVWPPGWCGAPMRMQAMLDHGWSPELMLATARGVMAGKRDGPPDTIAYFERPFARAHARQADPLPSVTIVPRKPEVIHAEAAAGRAGPGASADWRARRDAFVVAHNELATFCDADDEGGGEGGAADAQPVPAARRGGAA